MEDLLLRMIGESVKSLDAASLDLLQIVAWAALDVPRSGLLGLQQDGAALLTRLSRSNLLIVREGTAAEGRSFDMHPLVREAVTEFSRNALDFARIARVFRNAGSEEWKQKQFRPALALNALAERALRRVGKRDDLAAAIMGRGLALWNLGRLEEAVAAYDECIAIYRELVEKEHRQELRNDLARALYNLALAREKQNAMPAALEAAREARKLRKNLVKEGMKHLERDLADAKNLEARLAQHSR
jgi:tetratricopeptide (TPR) repeat protein